jgi:hypothetical protein
MVSLGEMALRSGLVDCPPDEPPPSWRRYHSRRVWVAEVELGEPEDDSDELGAVEVEPPPPPPPPVELAVELRKVP